MCVHICTTQVQQHRPEQNSVVSAHVYLSNMMANKSWPRTTAPSWRILMPIIDSDCRIELNSGSSWASAHLNLFKLSNTRVREYLLAGKSRLRSTARLLQCMPLSFNRLFGMGQEVYSERDVFGEKYQVRGTVVRGRAHTHTSTHKHTHKHTCWHKHAHRTLNCQPSLSSSAIASSYGVCNIVMFFKSA